MVAKFTDAYNYIWMDGNDATIVVTVSVAQQLVWKSDTGRFNKFYWFSNLQVICKDLISE